MARPAHLLVALALAVAPIASAQERSRPGSGSVLDLAIPDRAAALRIRAEARVRLVDALDGDRDVGLGPAPDVLLEQAVARYDAVLRTFPDDVDAWLERGRALAAFSRTLADGHVETHWSDAIASYERARALAPRREESFVAFELAVLRTRTGDYAGASAEYARSYEARGLFPDGPDYEVSRREAGIALLFWPPGAETTLENWAEVTMLSGEPAAAVERYQAALEVATTHSDSAALVLWGLALAEERAGSHSDALETALRAIDADPSPGHPERGRLVERHGAFSVLHLDGLFFEPPCEIHAYESLGHEALATRASTPEGRAAEWTAARLAARFFLAEGGRSSPYVDVATAAEARLGALLGP